MVNKMGYQGEGEAFFELSNEVLRRRKKHICFRARGRSMSPFIRDGEIIEIVPIDIKKIKSGDIIFYRSNSKKLVIHRVIKRILENGKIVFITKGDFSPTFDQCIHSNNVLGKVVAVKKKNRIIRFDKGLMRLLNVLWAKVSPFNPWSYPPLRIVKQWVYRILRFIGLPISLTIRTGLLS